MSVVLPQPVGPTMAMRWPGRTSSEVRDQRALRHIAEADLVEPNRAARLRADGVGAVRLLVGQIEQLKDAVGACERVLQLGHDAADFVERLGILRGVAQEHADLSDGDAAGDRVERADERDHGVDEVICQPCGRICQA